MNESRRLNRIIALQSLFYYLARDGKVDILDCFQTVNNEHSENKESTDFIDKPALDMAKNLVIKTVEEIKKIKLLIKIYAPEFPYEKMAPINKALLLLGICEMKFIETPPIVVINEYIELAKEFGEKKSAGFINAVLDSFHKQLEKYSVK